MKISFRRTGGFAPMPMICEIDGENLAATDRNELETLVEASGIMNETDALTKGARDLRYFTLDIDYNGNRKTLKWDELSLPEQVRPLINYLLARSQNLLDD